LQGKKALIASIATVIILSFAPGDAWSSDSSFSLKSFKEIINSFKESLSSIKEKLTPSKEKVDSVKESLSSVKDKLTPSKEKIDSLKKHISLDNRLVYQYRSTGSDKDSDFYEYWNLRGRNYYSGQLDFYFSGRLKKDLDGSDRSVDGDPFFSVEDLDGSWNDQIYQLYANWKDSKKRFSVKIGRQYIDDASWLHIDGGLLRFRERKKISGKVFLGKPVSYYTSTSDDWAGGYSASARIWKGNKARFTHVIYDDDRIGKTNNLASVDVWQRLGNRARTHGQVSLLDGNFQTIRGDLFYVAEDGLYDVYLKASHWGETDDETREYSPLASVLQKRSAFTLLTARGSYTVKPWLRVSPGIAVRIVSGSGNSYRNRDFGNFDVTFNIAPEEYWSTSITGNYWRVSDNNHFAGLTGAVDYHRSKVWSVSAGTAFMDYEYSAEDSGYETELSPDVYTIFGQAKVRITDSVSLKAELVLEDNSSEDDSSVRFRTTLSTTF
jgi:hypothetical protein